MPNSNNSFKKKAVRSLFLTFNKEEKTKDDIDNEILASGMKYIQMKLPVEKITREFEAEISSKIEHNVIQAKIRDASSKDLEIVTEIYNKSWLTSRTPFRPIEKGTLKTIFQDQYTIFLVARVYGIDSGFVILDLEGSNKEHGIIAGLGIIPRFQRKGLGTVLGMAAWNHFKKLGVKELRCEVYQDNEVSYNFISSIGFEEFGVKVYRSEDFNLD